MTNTAAWGSTVRDLNLKPLDIGIDINPKLYTLLFGDAKLAEPPRKTLAFDTDKGRWVGEGVILSYKDSKDERHTMDIRGGEWKYYRRNGADLDLEPSASMSVSDDAGPMFLAWGV